MKWGESEVARELQMLFRMQKFNEVDLYRYYNMDHPGYPDNLPPPPNPTKLRTFVVWCVNETVRQKNEENDPNAAKRRTMTP